MQSEKTTKGLKFEEKSPSFVRLKLFPFIICLRKSESVRKTARKSQSEGRSAPDEDERCWSQALIISKTRAEIIKEWNEHAKGIRQR